MRIAFRFFFLLLISLSQPALAQEAFSPYYVVIGGFSHEENAQAFCTYAHAQNLPALYAFNEERKMFYVYVRATQTREVAYDILKRLRAASVFTNAWVFNGVLSGSNLIARKQPPPVEEKVLPVPDGTPTQPEPALEEVVPEPVVSAPEDAPSASGDQEGEPQVEAARPVGKPFVFKLLNKETGSMVNGIVRLQERDKARQFRGLNGNEKVYVPAPANRSGKWIVVCHVLGFQPFKKSVAYEKPEVFEGATRGAADEIILPLPLERVRRGDYLEMQGVKFFNNAALLTPGSELELDQLVAMMKENPDYRIRLHGHTNGTKPRDIVSLGESTDFFNPNVSNSKMHATAKELSFLRAEIVKAYLVGKDIDPQRISTKGEGGKQMVFDPRGTLAGLNDRVEVEIRKH